MKTSSDGIEVLHYFESCRLEAYPDPGTGGAPWTIGWGDTGPDVGEGLTITQADANARFARKLAIEFEPGVVKALHVDATRSQFDALVCLAYNIGTGALSGSTLLRKFNAGDAVGAQDQFAVWNRSGGRVMLGLRRRRAAEAALFGGMTGKAAIAIGAAVK